jgi:hypothetical protein
MSQIIISIEGTAYEGVNLFGANPASTLTQAFTAATFAAVAVPAGSIGVLIIPDNANTGTLTIKGVTGDTGVNIRQAQPSFMALSPLLASFGLLSQNTQTITFIFV